MGDPFSTLIAPYAEGLGVAVAAGLTLMVYSYLLGDNFLFRLAEHVFIGVSVGYSAVVAFHSVLLPKLLLPLATSPQDNALLLVPLALSLMLAAYVVPRLRWLASIPLAFAIGIGAALSVGGALTGVIVPQLAATILPLSPRLPLGRFVDNLTIIVGTLSVVMYFYFTARPDRPTGRALTVIGSVGKWFMMIAFGAVFANVVMARITLLIGRVQFLLGEWLHVIK
jgi:hypothetical protein